MAAPTLARVTIGGNPEDVRARARRVRTLAAGLNSTASGVRAGGGIEWVGVASERYRARLADHARQVEAARGEFLGTAAALDHLADTLEQRQAAIRRAMEFVDDAVDDARRAVARLAGDTLSDAERATKRAAQEVLERAHGPCRSRVHPSGPASRRRSETSGERGAAAARRCTAGKARRAGLVRGERRARAAGVGAAGGDDARRPAGRGRRARRAGRPGCARGGPPARVGARRGRGGRRRDRASRASPCSGPTAGRARLWCAGSTSLPAEVSTRRSCDPAWRSARSRSGTCSTRCSGWCRTPP